MKFEIATACDAGTTNVGKLNVVGSFDMLFPPALPFNHLFYLAYKVRFDKKEVIPKDWEISILSPKKKPIFESSLEVSAVEKTGKSTKSRWKYIAFSLLVSVQFDSYGEHTIIAKTGGKKVNEIHIDVGEKKD